MPSAKSGEEATQTETQRARDNKLTEKKIALPTAMSTEEATPTGIPQPADNSIEDESLSRAKSTEEATPTGIPQPADNSIVDKSLSRAKSTEEATPTEVPQAANDPKEKNTSLPSTVKSREDETQADHLWFNSEDLSQRQVERRGDFDEALTSRLQFNGAEDPLFNR